MRDHRLGDIPFNPHLAKGKKGRREAVLLFAIFVVSFVVWLVTRSGFFIFFAIVFLASAIVRSIPANVQYTRGITIAGEDLKKLDLTDVQYAGDGFIAKHQGKSFQIRLEHGRYGRLDVLLDQPDY